MKKFDRESGQVLVLSACGMAVLLGFLAFSTDVGVLLHTKRQMQAAADAAALAGATEALAEGNPSTLSTGEYSAADNDAALNGFAGGSSSGTANSSTGTTLRVNLSPNITVSTFNSAGYVQATISKPMPAMILGAFMGLFGNRSFSGFTVSATAVASDIINSKGCFYVTDLTGDEPSFDISTGNNTVTTTSCGIYINGNLDIGGSSSITAGSVLASGTITGGSAITGTYASGVPPQPLPLAQLQQASDQPTNINTSTTPGTCTPPAGSGFSSSQCYVNATLTGALSPGLYVFTTTPTFGSNVSGSDVVIYLDGSVPYNDGNDVIGISGPTSGIFAGVVLDAPTDSPGSGFGCPHGNGPNNVAGVLHIGFGSSKTAYEGAVYAPYAHLFMQDQGAGTTTIKTDLVVGTICGQSADLEVSGISGDSPITQVGLVY
jgi:Flp pilus assembly protein TadG